MSSEWLDGAAKLIDQAKEAVGQCSSGLLPGEALVIACEAREQLEEAIAELRAPGAGERWQLEWLRWHKPMEPKLFHRFDSALCAMVLEITLVRCDVRLRQTEEDDDGSTKEWRASGGGAELRIRRI